MTLRVSEGAGCDTATSPWEALPDRRLSRFGRNLPPEPRLLSPCFPHHDPLLSTMPTWQKGKWKEPSTIGIEGFLLEEAPFAAGSV